MANDISKIKTPDGVVHDLKDSRVPANAKFTDTNYYHTTGSWNGLTYTATANGGAGALALTLPTGTTSTTVALGNHTHNYLPLSGGTLTGTLSMQGVDIQLTTPSSSSNDSADLVWYYGNSQEKMRLWSEDTYTAKSGPNFRIYTNSGSALYTGKLPLADGTSASGTWGISITGNATTATTATKLANTSAIGDANRPVYFTSDGVPTPISSSLGSAAYTSSDGYASVEHTHAAGDIDSGQFALARIPTGTTSTTVALGDHTHSYLYGVTGQAVTAAAGNYTMAFYPMVYAGTSGLFPTSNNANAIITFNRHTGGGYYSQLGFSSNGNIYYRCFNGAVINTTTAWQRLVTSSDTSTFLTATSDLREAYLTWGGKNFAGNFGPLDAALDPALGANRFELMPGDKITIEYSNNDSTYYNYGTSANENAALFAGEGSATWKIGKNPSTKTVNDRLRVTVDCNGVLYTVLNKFIIKLSRNGSSNCWVKIEGALYNASAPQSWTTIVEKQGVDGWWGWNVINTGNVTVTASTHANYYRWLRFTFGADKASTGTDCLTIYKICAYGGMGWSKPSVFAGSGHIYSWNQYAEVFFPSTIYESGTSLANKYAGISHSHTFTSLTSRPTTLYGYGITDFNGVTSSGGGFVQYNQDDGFVVDSTSYLPRSGGTITGALTFGASGTTNRKLVPSANATGYVGTSSVRWGAGYFNALYCA